MSTLTERVDQLFDQSFPGADTSIYRDLMMNLRKILVDSPLDEQERCLNLAAVSASLKNYNFLKFAEAELATQGLTLEQIREASEVAAIMGMLNTYYKFRSYLPDTVKENYARAGLRMQSLMKPANGKERFEQMAMAVSVVNGCPSCIAAHEEALTKLGVLPEKVHELARMAAAMKGLTDLQHLSSRR
jgi:lipoyl-dependent peroxiredoxin subunit D